MEPSPAGSRRGEPARPGLRGEGGKRISDEISVHIQRYGLLVTTIDARALLGPGLGQDAPLALAELVGGEDERVGIGLAERERLADGVSLTTAQTVSASAGPGGWTMSSNPGAAASKGRRRRARRSRRKIEVDARTSRRRVTVPPFACPGGVLAGTLPGRFAFSLSAVGFVAS